MLMNIGPTGNGDVDPEGHAILHGIAAWWKVNGESIRGTTRTPLPVQAWGESTRKGNTLYLHVFDWPSDGKLVVGGLKTDVKGAPGCSVANQERIPEEPYESARRGDLGFTRRSGRMPTIR